MFETTADMRMVRSANGLGFLPEELAVLLDDLLDGNNAAQADVLRCRRLLTKILSNHKVSLISLRFI